MRQQTAIAQLTIAGSDSSTSRLQRTGGTPAILQDDAFNHGHISPCSQSGSRQPSALKDLAPSCIPTEQSFEGTDRHIAVALVTCHHLSVCGVHDAARHCQITKANQDRWASTTSHARAVIGLLVCQVVRPVQIRYARIDVP
jgi:hypothetical protein